MQVEGDRLALDGDGKLGCGAYGDDSAVVWLSGGGPAAVTACSGRAINDSRVEVKFSDAKGLIPAQPTLIRLTLAPAAVATKRHLAGGVNITLLPVEQPASTVWNSAWPVAPGVAALALRLEQCHILEVPEAELDPVISPTGLRIGNSTMAAYYGGLTAHAGILVAWAGASGLLYLTVAGRARCKREGREDYPSIVLRLKAARLGPLVYALSFAYPGSVQIGMATAFYGCGGWPGFAVAVVVVLLMLPMLALWATHNAPRYATVQPVPGKPSGLKWFFNGSKRWVPRGKGKLHRIFRLFYSDYGMSDKCLCPAELLLNTFIAVLHSVRPQTEAECDVIGYMVLSLMVGFALYVTVRRSILAPYLLCMTSITLLGEVAAKTLLVVFGAGMKNSHWAVATAKGIATGLGWVMFVRGGIGFGVLLLDEYGHWVDLPGGGKQRPERLRPLYFVSHWFFFHGVVDAMMGPEKPRHRVEKTRVVDQSLPGSPAGSYSAMHSPPAEHRATFDTLALQPTGASAALTQMDPAEPGHACPLRPEPRCTSPPPSPSGTTAAGSPPVHCPLRRPSPGGVRASHVH